MSTKNEQNNDSQEQEDQQEVDLREQDQDEGDFVKIPKKDHKAIKDQLKRANSEAKQHRELAAAYKELGYEPDEIKEFIARAQEKSEQGDNSGQDDTASKEQFERQLSKQRKELERKHQTELQKAREELAQLNQTLENTVLLQQAESVILQHDGVPDLIMDRVRKHAKVVKEGDRFTTRVVDENGETEFNDRGEYATLEDFIVGLKNDEKFGRAFGAPKKSGAGIRNQNDSDGSRRNSKEFGDLRRSQMTKVQQNRFVKEHGPEAFFALEP